jgi:hypothetical protein
MRALWDFARLEDRRVLPDLKWLSKSGLLRGKVGIECPCCHAHFRVTQIRIIAVRVVVGLSLLASAWVLGAKMTVLANQRIEVALALGGVLGFAWIERYLTPYLAQVRHVPGEEKLSYPLKSAYQGPSDPAST